MASARNRSQTVRLERLVCAVRDEYASERETARFRVYRTNPERFAEEVLGSRWWSRQRETARRLVTDRRVAVRSANGVGKTYLAADLALWFLYCYQPSIVVTTAPTIRQVEKLLWEEIHRRRKAARVQLAGKAALTEISLSSGWYAIGQTAVRGDAFQGYHQQNLLVIFDEASGVEDEIWDAAEGVAVADNNKILAIGNPLRAAGRFYEVFHRDNTWVKLSISALEHPNLTGKEDRIEGAVTEQAVEDRICEWCDEQSTESRAESPGSEESRKGGSRATDVFAWKGRRYTVNNLFRSRVLGEFPDADEQSLIPLRWIEAAMDRFGTLPEAGVKRAAVDVARFGDDLTVIGFRAGPVVTRIEPLRGHDTVEVTDRVQELAYEEKPASIAVDEIGVGAGVVDQLRHRMVAGVAAVNVAHSAFDEERFENRRAELFWGLRERFRSGEIALPRDEEIKAELSAIRYHIRLNGRIALEKKEDMKKRIGRSPDRADMLAMLFDSSCDWIKPSKPEAKGRVYVRPSPLEAIRRGKIW